MMDFKAELRELIKEYADFDENAKEYKTRGEITDVQKQKIEASFITLVSQYLSQGGVAEEPIRKHGKALALQFHPDKYSSITTWPESQWIQYIMSSGDTVKGVCFNLIVTSEKKLIKPETPEFHFDDITNIQILIVRLQEERKQAQTYTQRALLDSIIVMLTSAEKYNAQMHEKVPMVWAERLAQSMPYLTSGYCASFFLKEVVMFYAVTYFLSKGGQLAENSTHFKKLGSLMRFFSDTISTATTALLARLVELNIFVVQGTINLSIDTSTSFYKLLTSTASINTPNEPKAMVLEPVNLFSGPVFKTVELKLLSIIFEKKEASLQKQWLSSMRTGSKKLAEIKKIINGLQRIDLSEIDLRTKFNLAEKIINRVAKNKKVNAEGSATNKTINMALIFLQTLRESALSKEQKKSDNNDKLELIESKTEVLTP